MYYSADGLRKFVSAHTSDYASALSEIKSGKKRSHWVWYIFPQLQGLGMSPTAQYYAIKDAKQAKDFLEHPYLGKNLIEISNALLKLETSNATEVLGYPDDLKLRSCMTLFEVVDPSQEVFGKVLDKFYRGRRDEVTLRLLGVQQ